MRLYLKIIRDINTKCDERIAAIEKSRRDTIEKSSVLLKEICEQIDEDEKAEKLLLKRICIS